jgi:hypothetical protein
VLTCWINLDLDINFIILLITILFYLVMQSELRFSIGMDSSGSPNSAKNDCGFCKCAHCIALYGFFGA